MYVRLTKTLQDKGTLLPQDQVEAHVDDYSIDWYYSAYWYNEEVLEYWDNNNKSIAGFAGEGYTDTLFWDLDFKPDFEKVRQSALVLIEHLYNLGFNQSVEIYFSGNKGVHILLKTGSIFNHKETRQICTKLAKEAGVSSTVFDMVVYNATRVFRVANTKHQDSGLYKIAISESELRDLSEMEIRKLAENPRDVEYESAKIDAEFLKKKYYEVDAAPKKEFDVPDGLDLSGCPPNKRKCIYTLEQGFFGQGERENALIRLAAYHKGQGFTKDVVRAILNKALELRESRYESLNPYNDSDTERILNVVYSDTWAGGIYSCDDPFLLNHCDSSCGFYNQEDELNIEWNTIDQVIESYEKYGKEAQKEYPKTGIDWVDNRIRLRPRNYSILNGSNGSGKTSVIIQIIENLNKQQIYHMIFSLDMANTSLLEKMATKHTEYTPQEVEAAFNKYTYDIKKVKNIKTLLKENYPYTLFNFKSMVTSDYIEKVITSYNGDKSEKTRIQIVFIDYAGRLVGSEATAYAMASKNALAANDICKNTNTHLMYISQISRDKGDHTEPLHSSRIAKDSGHWEENATIVINVWRPFGNGLQADDEYLHLYIAKNRAGCLDECVFHWNGKTGTIAPMTKDEFRQYIDLCQQHHKDLPTAQARFIDKDSDYFKREKTFKIVKKEKNERIPCRTKFEDS